MRKIATLSVLSMLVVMALPLVAQDGPPDGQLYRIHTYRVSPGAGPAYEEGLKKLFAAYKKSGVDFPTFTSSSMSDPGSYTFVIPMSSMSDWDAQQQKLSAAWQTVPEVITELGGMSQGNDTAIVAFNKGLSYAPESPRVGAEERNFHTNFYLYVKPSEGQALQAVIQEFQALYKKKGIDTPFSVFGQVIGADSPLVVVRIGGKDAADFYAHQAKLQERLAADTPALAERLGRACRRMETQTMVTRRDLSYVPE